MAPNRPDETEPLVNSDRHDSWSNTDNDAVVHKQPPGDLEGLRLYLALTFPISALFFVALDVTMVSTVSATIAAEFSSLAMVSWLGSAYLVAVAAIQPISGKLTDRFGRRTGFFWALFFFGAGNLMCGLAPADSVLIAGRAVAGIGGGAMSSIGVFITGDLLPLRKRAFWQGLGNVFWAMGMGIGGVFGGFVNDTIGWRWTFIVLVPCTAAVAVGAHFTLVRGLPRRAAGDENAKSSRGIDVLGSTLLSSTLVTLVIGLNLQDGGQNQLPSVILLVVSAVALVSFLVAEIWYVADPVVPLHLLASRSVAGVCISGFLTAVSMHSLLFYVPLYFQVRGYSASKTGLLLLGNPLGSFIGPFCTGVALQAIGGYAVIKPVVYLVYLAGPIGYYLSTFTTPVWALILQMVFAGAGYGSILTFILTGLLANIDDRYQATATGLQYAFRQTGGAAGLAVSGIIFRAKVERLAKAGMTQAGKSFFSFVVPENISDECSRNNYVDGDPPQMCQFYYNALHDVFTFILIATIAAFLFAMIVRNRPLDRKGSEGEE